MIKQNLAIILLSGITLTACAKSTNNTEQDQKTIAQQNLSSEQQRKLQELLDKTKKNLVEIKGGTFMMGDFGEQKSPDKLPYDSDADSKPLHKVTLDNYALSATKATYADFDIYTEVTGQQKIGKFDKFSMNERVPTAAADITANLQKITLRVLKQEPLRLYEVQNHLMGKIYKYLADLPLVTMPFIL